MLKEKSTQINRGENQNRTLRNINIVIQTKSVKLNNSSGKITIDIPTQYKDEKGLKVIGLIEDDELNIYDATQIQLD